MAEDKVKRNEPVTVKSPLDIPEPGKHEYRFRQNGQDFIIEFYPLTAEEVEHIRSSFKEPEPPTKALEGKGAMELQTLAGQGVPTTYKDYQDPAYQEALATLGRDRNLEMVRVSLRWGPMPEGQKPNEELLMAREEFRAEMRRRLTAGNYTKLLDAVTATSFSLDQSLVEGFLTPSAQPTPTGEDS